jgi:ribonuclease HI
MKPVFNLEPRYRVTMLTREDWTKGQGAPPEVKGLVWFTDGSKVKGGTGAEIYGQSLRRRLSFYLGKYAKVFQAEIHVILTCAHEIQSLNRSERYVSICSDSQAALKALQAVRTTSPLVHQCQRALNDISARHVVRLYWVPGHATVRGNGIADGARDGSGQGFLGPEPVLGVSSRDVQNRHGPWLNNQHCASWNDPSTILRQARELISGPNRSNMAKFLFLNRTQSRVVTDFLTGHNTLRMHLFLLGLANSPMCRGCGMKEEISAHVHVNVRPGPHLDMRIWAPFWNQGTLTAWVWGPSVALVKLQGSHDSDLGHKGPVYKA